ncbi:MAG: hypothetical protein KDA63_06730 [Planctomycetales bacterium]|nr:hypothetical protein [Planctomycetales bacterium]
MAAVLYSVTATDVSFAAAVALRVGLITLAWWLAYPSFAKMPRWLLLVIGALLIVVAIRPRTVLFAGLVLIAIALLRPRVKQLADAVAEQQRHD